MFRVDLVKIPKNAESVRKAMTVWNEAAPGLLDRRTGLCSDLMSGASAGLGCSDPHPSKAEAEEVAGKLANPGTRADRPEVLHVDVWLPEKAR